MRFSAANFYGGVFKCHCSRCRKAFGGASSAATLCPEKDFRWLTGEKLIHSYRTDSGFTRFFCRECGSILPQHLPQHQSYWVPAGLLEDDPDLTLRKHIYVNSKAAWEVLDQDTPTLPEGFV
ncbi:MAG: hypothetical protein Hals2KO_04730 [Halioglobus sp.]